MANVLYNSFISKAGRITHLQEGTLVLQIHINYSTGIGIIGTVDMKVCTGPEREGHCI